MVTGDAGACLYSKLKDKPSHELILHIIALTQQIEILMRNRKRPRLTLRDRLFWFRFAHKHSFWKECLYILSPQTIIHWHRVGFRHFWRWRSRSAKRGRPRTPEEIRELITRMASENPTWGAPQIFFRLRKLGIHIARSTVSKYLPQPDRRPPHTWRAFLRNHAKQIAACDFFTVPTWNFAILYCFIVMSHDRRRILRLDVTRNPTAKWAAKQLRLALTDQPGIKYLIHDHDSIFGPEVSQQLTQLEITQVRTGVGAPWQNGHCERLIGSIKRECTDHLIPLGTPHLRNLLNEYKSYYNTIRLHTALDGDSPEPSAADPPENGAHILALPILGGLHHQYKRAA
ncbi:transposase [Candidatus Sumerlaeota bacterium]